MNTNGTPPVAVLEVVMHADGNVQMRSQGPNVVVLFGMLEVAKDLLHKQAAKPKPGVEVAPPGFRLP